MTSFKDDPIDLEFTYDRLNESTKEYIEIEEALIHVSDFYRRRGMSELADRIYQTYYSQFEDHEKEMKLLKKIKKKLDELKKKDERIQNIIYEEDV